jgi:hypothetical protein
MFTEYYILVLQARKTGNWKHDLQHLYMRSIFVLQSLLAFTNVALTSASHFLIRKKQRYCACTDAENRAISAFQGLCCCYTGCLKIHGTHVTANNSANINVLALFFQI